MSRQDPVPNYLSVSYDSMALLLPLGRPVRRGVPSLRQPSEVSSPTLSHSLVAAVDVTTAAVHEAASTFCRDSDPQPRRVTALTGICHRIAAASICAEPERYSKSELIELALLRQIEVLPQQATFTEPRRGTIFEEFTKTDQGLVVECARSQNEMAESGQYSGFSTFDEKTNLDILDKD
ncbi:hypothetical protein HPB51_000214 [Rhipicephalus microplus]|uniref:Uncharacterized protein n=1 Tax=Rhipicephalus microplus TaxID=6941 RepID=A0A9J6E511_RHIMP|nr:hypothetical protein HPB51_000214 [Rhipicephalus microplus]